MVKTPELTENQIRRRDLYFALRQCIARALGEKQYDIDAHTQTLWIHFTDWYGNYDLPALINEHLVELDVMKTYIPDGTWRDHFPPTAYKLTDEGLEVYDHPLPYIYDGKVYQKS